MKYKISLIRGGSGTWNLRLDGKIIASGHIPNRAPFKEVVRNQLKRVALAESTRAMRLTTRRLGGGHLENLSGLHNEIEAVVGRYEALIAEEVKESPYESLNPTRKDMSAKDTRDLMEQADALVRIGKWGLIGDKLLAAIEASNLSPEEALRDIDAGEHIGVYEKNDFTGKYNSLGVIKKRSA